MRSSRIFLALSLSLAVGSAGAARAGAPQPDTRQGDFAHVCSGGPNKGLACAVPTEDADCPQSACVVQALSRPVPGVLTIIAHDSVTDWLTGASGHRAVTILLEVRAPGGSKPLLAATYQDLVLPTEPPQAPSNVIAIGMDELALRALALAPGGLLFVQPESTLAQELQAIFDSTGTPVLAGVNAKQAQSDDHTADGLATVLRMKVKLQFVEPL